MLENNVLVNLSLHISLDTCISLYVMICFRTHILGQLRALGFVRARGGGDIRDLNTNSENWAVVKAALTAGSYPNILRYDRVRNMLNAQYVITS